MSEVKKRLPLNLFTNLLSIAVSILAGLWLTPLLIKNLGIEVYGIIPLITSVLGYMNLVTGSLTSSVGRFVSIFHVKGDEETSNMYFNTAFRSLLLIGIVILIVLGISTPYLRYIFNLPKGYELSAGVYFMLSVLASIIAALTSPFQVSTFVTHRFDLQNLTQIVARMMHVLLIPLLFLFLEPSLIQIGTVYTLSAFFVFLMAIVFTKKLTPDLKLKKGLFQKRAFWEMSRMSGWGLLDSLGTLFYFSIDLIIINIVLGPKEGGLYAPIVMIVMLLERLTGAVSGLFTPVAYKYAAQNNFKELTLHSKRVVEYVSLMMSIPVGLISGFALSILTLWLGEQFSGLYHLLWILLIPKMFSYSVRPLFSINRGFNKIKIPALVTFSGGILNVALSYFLVSRTSMGIQGVAFATAFCLTLREMVFVPLYAARLLRCRPHTFYMPTIAGFLVMLGTWQVSHIYQSKMGISSLGELALISSVIGIFFALIIYLFVLKRDDRVLMIDTFLRRRKGWI